MDISKYTEMISRKSKDALLIMLKNARNRNAHEHEDLVLHELDKRFPGWELSKGSRSGGRTANRAIYRGKERSFATAKNGYSWLVEQMLHDVHRSPDVPDEKLDIASTDSRKYLARSPSELFRNSPHLAEDTNNYVKMPYGWYLNVNMSNEHKFDVLARLSWVVGVYFPADWDWIVEANTEDIVRKRERQIKIEELHKFFEGILKNRA